MKSTYASPLRERQKADTRALILETVERLLTGRSLGELSLATVALEAGVTERTVYRHFETREQLLEATWSAVNEAIGITVHAGHVGRERSGLWKAEQKPGLCELEVW